MSYLDYPGLTYFKSLLDQTYLRVDYDGDTTIAGHVTFTSPVTGDIDGRAKKDWLGQQLDTTYLKDIQPDENGALKLILGNGQVSHLVTDTTVTQERSTANETYPILLCYDENATENQIAKKVKYGHDVQINPAYGYIYAGGYLEKHPLYNRTITQNSRVEWTVDFRDNVLNPVSQIYSYIDPSNQGGEHRMEFRLYGNPHTTSLNLPNYNFETDTVSLGISSTKGDKLTFFGYAPSTPIYLENGSTLRKSTVRGDQYGRDIITRDWLDLNGSITGLVHTSMDETIDGTKTFVKKIVANDGMNATGNVAADTLTIRQDASIGRDLTVTRNETVDGTLGVTGASTFDGNVHMLHNLDVDGTANVDGTSTLHGDVHMYNNLDVDKNANVDGNETVGGTLTVTGKITGNGGAAISGGNGLQVTGNETVSGNLTVNGTTTTNDLFVTDDATIGDDLTVNGDASVAGVINKKSGNTTQEYVSYITNQQSTRETIINNMIKNNGGLAIDSNKEIYVKLSPTGGVKLSNNGELYVDFSLDSSASAEAQAAANRIKEQLLSSLGIQIPLTSNKTFYVNKEHSAATTIWRNDKGVIDDTVGTSSKPFKTIQSAISCATQGYSVGSYHIDIVITKSSDAGYNEVVTLPQYSHTTGYIRLVSADISDVSNYAVITNKNTSTTDTSNARSTGGLVSVSGSGWYIQHIKFDSEISDPGNGIANFPSCLAAGSNASVSVSACSFNFVYSGDAVSSGGIYMRMISATSGGVISFALKTDYQTTISVAKNNANTLSVFFCERQGQINFNATNNGDSNSTWHNIECNGSCTRFIDISIGSVFAVIGGAIYVTGFTGNLTGSICAVKQLSSLTCSSIALSALTQGTKDSTSYVSSAIDVAE